MKFLGYDGSEDLCHEVVNMCSLENLKRLEKERSHYYEIAWKEGKGGIAREGMNVLLSHLAYFV